MKDVKDAVRRAFGVDGFEQPVFYEFEFALRFELGGEVWGMDRAIRRFLQAHRRASQVAAALFAGRKPLVLFESWGNAAGTPLDFSEVKLVFPKIARDVNLVEIAQDPDGTCTHWHCVRVEDDHQIEEMLWLCVAAEMPIRPDGRDFNAFIVDLDAATALHVYDDRGMDVVAMRRETLQPIYDRFQDWLLGYAIDRMTATFGA